MRRVFRILQNLIVLALVLGGSWYLLNNQQAQAKVELLAYNAQLRLAQLTGQKTSTKKVASTDQANIKGRWAKKTATVYVDTGNSTLNAATISAMSQWNRTGAFNFQQTTDKKHAQIVVKSMDSNDDAAGTTQTLTSSMTGQIEHATVFLNNHYLLDPNYGYSEERIVNTAEHELGHAIGLNHSNQVSVMQPAGSFYTIQPGDVAKVNQLYANAK